MSRKVMPKKAKRKKKTLTKAHKRLLQYPPTPETWVCKCNMVNAGRHNPCLWCKADKPKRPKLLWPVYLEACAILGIAPGTRIRYHKALNKPMVFNGTRYRFLDEEAIDEHPKVQKIIKRKNN